MVLAVTGRMVMRALPGIPSLITTREHDKVCSRAIDHKGTWAMKMVL